MTDTKTSLTDLAKESSDGSFFRGERMAELEMIHFLHEKIFKALLKEQKTVSELKQKVKKAKGDDLSGLNRRIEFHENNVKTILDYHGPFLAALGAFGENSEGS